MPGVLQCAAIGVSDKKAGEVVKMFVVTGDTQLSADEVIEFVVKIWRHTRFPSLSSSVQSYRSVMSARWCARILKQRRRLQRQAEGNLD